MADDLDTISKDIERLGGCANDLQALSAKAIQAGDAAKAQDLATQAVIMMGKKAELSAKRRSLETSNPEWRQLLDNLDDLEQKAQGAKADMQKTQDTVEAAKTVLGAVSKILTVL